MIAFLRGHLIDRNAEQVILDVGGVGYLISVTARALRSLPAERDKEARLHIYTHASQDNPFQLFGFPDAQERRLFETLISVQGVGPRVAIAILSNIGLADLVRAVTSSDVQRLTQVKGIGKKIAERLCVELRDRIGAASAGASLATISGGAPSGMPAQTGTVGEVQGALLALGFTPSEVAPVLPKLDASKSTPDLIKDALALLRKG
ncbi:MAG: Holliday junction branch migration protein RuvA [Deltaproteobacteria bacterium]|nr:Holliday junction branch migration protein RuvA [Deltaproteobacteria bacterium]